jgi:hypothetical protein
VTYNLIELQCIKAEQDLAKAKERITVLEKALREISEIGWSPRDGHIRIARAALAPEVKE